MLTLSLKTGESVYIGLDIEVIVTHTGNHHSRISINAPKEIRILRAELLGDTREEREWMRELRKVAIERGPYDLETVDKWDPVYWLDYMDEGLTPEQALIEDAKEGGFELTLKEPGIEDQCLEWITQEANAAPALRQKLMEAYKQRDELLAALKKSIQLLESPVTSFECGSCMCGGDMKGHPSGLGCEHDPVDAGLYYASETIEKIKEAVTKAEATSDLTKADIRELSLLDLSVTKVRPFEIIVNGRVVETIDVDVTERSGEEFLTPDSSEKIEQVRAKYLPPEGWAISTFAGHFERIGDGVWLVPTMAERMTAPGAWQRCPEHEGAHSINGVKYMLPVSAVKGGKL